MESLITNSFNNSLYIKAENIYLYKENVIQ